jgi:uncharacterized secreted protein with C-terminal beta-propeller domain
MVREKKENVEEISTESALVEVVHKAEIVETYEERDARLRLEDYQRRNLEAIREREAIMRRNGVLAPDEPFSMDPDAAVNQRCCF